MFELTLWHLVGFMLGAALGARALKHLKPVSFARTSGIILALLAVIALIVSLSWWQADSITSAGQIAITTILATLMGAQVAAVKPIGTSDITTVVVTSTIANLARESRLAGTKQAAHVWRDRLGAIIAMGLGATFGAALVSASGGPAALILAIAVMSAATWMLVTGSRNHQIFLASETS